MSDDLTHAVQTLADTAHKSVDSAYAKGKKDAYAQATKDVVEAREELADAIWQTAKGREEIQFRNEPNALPLMRDTMLALADAVLALIESRFSGKEEKE